MRPHDTVAPERTPRWRATSIIASAVLTASGGIAGCSVLYELKTEQCASTADCVALGGVFAELECVQNICQEPLFTGCRSNIECMDANQGNPFACIDSACVDLRSPECPLILPQTQELWRENLRSENPLILAGFGPAVGGFGNEVRNYDLALTEFSLTGVGPESSIGPRKLVMVACESTIETPEQLDRTMTHLADELKVPGIISALFADDLQRAFQTKGLAANMFFMSPLESDPTLRTLEDNGLVWHVGPAPDVLARVYAPLLTRTLAFLNVPAGEAKVATLVASDQRFMSSMMQTIQSDPDEFGIMFNGSSVGQNRDTDKYIGLTLTANATSFDTQIAQLRAFRPHVIISAGGPNFLRSVIPVLESTWDDSDGRPPPFYVLSPFQYNSLALQELVTNIPAVRTRLLGVNGPAAEDPDVFENYTVRWDTAFTDKMGEHNYENFYDAAYYLIYAGIAAGSNGVDDGLDLKDGMEDLLGPGAPHEVGPADMPRAVQDLNGGAIRLTGTLGPPDFDRQNGTRSAVGTVWCQGVGNSTQSDVLRYVAGAIPGDARLEGTFPPACFSGF